jgi:SdrD B-like protein
MDVPAGFSARLLRMGKLPNLLGSLSKGGEVMKTTTRQLTWLSASGATVAALALACLAVACGGGGGGGGGMSGGASQVSGSLSKASGMQTASLGRGRSLSAHAASWFGVSNAMAEATTNCGHVEAAANDVQVRLLMSGAVIETTMTNGDGHFTFTDLAPGDYVIQIVLPSGTISAPVIVQPGQTTNLTGELDVDCHDVDHDGNTTEIALHVDEDTDDGSTMSADETEFGGDFHGEVHEDNGTMKMENGHRGDRGDETDSES